MFWKILSIILPWKRRRKILIKRFGFEIHPTARIGRSWVFPKKLIMEEKTYIGDVNMIKGADLVHMKPFSRIGRLNWITGFPSGGKKHFVHQPERKPHLLLQEHSAVTSRHLIDCTNTVTIGAFSTFAGFRSQILTHSIDMIDGRQSSHPITIGHHCFVGTNCVLLGGCVLPDYAVLGAMSMLNKEHTEQYYLYGGVPAKPVKKLPEDAKYFTREVGFVY